MLPFGYLEIRYLGYIIPLEGTKMRPVFRSALLLCGSAWFAAYGQSDLPRFGVGVDLSTLGPGIEAATAVTRRSNVRLGFNDFSYSRNFTKDGIHYGGELTLRSLSVLYDQYLVGGLHISPGLMLYNGNRGAATAAVPGGQSFTLGGTAYFSSAANPVTGTGSLSLGSVSPMVLIGVGNLLPRSQRHFSVGLDVGVVFQGAPKATLNLTGSTCDSTGHVCLPIAGNPVVQSSIQAEQTKINRDLNFFRYYPVVMLGFGYKF